MYVDLALRPSTRICKKYQLLCVNNNEMTGGRKHHESYLLAVVGCSCYYYTFIE